MYAAQIAPSILSCDFTRLADEVAAVTAAGADMLHIDVMDGHFVPNLTIGLPVIKSLRKITRLPLDVHLMISNAEVYLQDYVEAGADILMVHQEACTHLHRAVREIKRLGAEAGVVLNPATPVETLRNVLTEIDVVLLMTVNPGYGGQLFIEESLDKVRRLISLFADHGVRPRIEVDGGVKIDNIGKLASAGVDRFVAGSAIFNSDNYGDTIRALREQLTSAAVD